MFDKMKYINIFQSAMTSVDDGTNVQTLSYKVHRRKNDFVLAGGLTIVSRAASEKKFHS